MKKILLSFLTVLLFVGCSTGPYQTSYLAGSPEEYNTAFVQAEDGYYKELFRVFEAVKVEETTFSAQKALAVMTEGEAKMKTIREEFSRRPVPRALERYAKVIEGYFTVTGTYPAQLRDIAEKMEEKQGDGEALDALGKEVEELLRSYEREAKKLEEAQSIFLEGK